MNSEDYIVVYVNKEPYHIPVTFLDTHPGGRESIIKKHNQDCTQDFEFHRKNGKLEWQKYKLNSKKDNQLCIIC